MFLCLEVPGNMRSRLGGSGWAKSTSDGTLWDLLKVLDKILSSAHLGTTELGASEVSFFMEISLPSL